MSKRLLIAYEIGESLDETIDKKEEELEIEKQINKTIGLSGVAIKGLGGLFKKMGVDSTVVGESVKKSELAMRGAALSGGKLKTAFTGVKTLVGGIATSLMDPLIFVQLFIEGLAKADKETTELKKSMALTTGESMGFRTNLAVAAATSPVS